MDTADEAGGEAVFTSDGLPSLAAPLPPPPLPPIGGIGGNNDSNNNNNSVDSNNGGDAVEEDSAAVDPRAAFEAFSSAGTGWMGIANDKKTSVASSDKSHWEDPRRKLFRLKSEIDRLEASLASENNDKAAGYEGGNNKDNEELQAMAIELKSRLNALGLADASSLATLLRGRQEDLSSVISRDLEMFGANKGASGEEGDALSVEMGGLSLSRGEKKDAEGKIVYELYRAAALSTGSGAKTIPREVMLEERLRKLEIAMGCSSNGGCAPTDGSGGSNNKSILERIEEAERLTKEVDAKQVEKLAAKAKVVRADLEAAARARAKLASSSKSSASTSKDDAQVISALHAQLVELEGMSSHLPALTTRLVELSTLHSNAADFASRLHAAEEAVARSEGVLRSVEGALSKMEGGWEANMEGVRKNVDRLDKLLLAEK